MTTKNGNPGAGNAGASNARSTGKQNSSKTTSTPPWLEVTWSGQPTVVRFTGREAQTLALLIRYGSTGFTSGQASVLGWARRTSAYIFKLRKAGLNIATHTQTLSCGTSVGRYVLLTPAQVVARHGC